MTDQKSVDATPASDVLPTLLVREEEARSPVRVKLSLDEEQCATLAERCGLQAIETFALKATGTRIKGGKLRIEGVYEAIFTYVCGVTLQPFNAKAAEKFDQIFVDPQRVKPEGVTIEVDPLSDNDPDLLVGGAADVADLAFQLFTLALDPYPRHPDAVLASEQEEEADKEGQHDETRSPFAVLKDLKLN